MYGSTVTSKSPVRKTTAEREARTAFKRRTVHQEAERFLACDVPFPSHFPGGTLDSWTRSITGHTHDAQRLRSPLPPAQCCALLREA